MIFGQAASAAMLFAKFHAGTRKFLSDFWPPLLEHPIQFILMFTYNTISLITGWIVYTEKYKARGPDV